MTYLDPNAMVPQYEADRDELRACWPDLVAVATTPRAAQYAVFHELSPLPGGFFLAGVGEAVERPHLRDELLAHVTAGADLKEALRMALGGEATQSLGASACYVHFDPLEATLRIESAGPHVSAIYLTAGASTLLRTATESDGGTPTTLVLRPGEALALLARPRAWEKHVLSAVHRALPNDTISFTDANVRDLCAVLEDVEGPSAMLVLYRRDAAGTTEGGGRGDSLMPAGEMSPV